MKSEKKLSTQFVEFIDLSDENLEEIIVPEIGRIQGAGCSCSCGSCGSCEGFGSCSCGSCGSCDDFGSCGSCGFWSCSCFSCDFGSCGSCGSCSCWD